MKLLLLLFTLLAIASAAVYRTHLTRIESNRHRLMRLGKWREHLIAKDLLRAKGIGHLDLVDFDDEEYLGNITVGTPPTQHFRVFMNTDTGNTFIMDKDCISCTQNSLFDSSKSTTYKADGSTFHMSYGPLAVDGVYGQDTLSIGGIVVQNQIFAQIHYQRNFGIADGMFGLAFPAMTYRGLPPIINAIGQGVLDKPIFTIWLDRAGHQVEDLGGRITFGAMDDVYCNSEVVYQPLSAATMWLFRMRSIAAGSYSNNVGWTVETSSFDSFITGPVAIVEPIAALFGATRNPDDLTFHLPDCSIPKYPIEIVIGAKTYTIQPENLVVDDSTTPGIEQCTLMLAAYDFGGFGPQWSIGIPFTRQYCLIHDIGQQRIGFAARKKLHN